VAEATTLQLTSQKLGIGLLPRPTAGWWSRNRHRGDDAARAIVEAFPLVSLPRSWPSLEAGGWLASQRSRRRAPGMTGDRVSRRHCLDEGTTWPARRRIGRSALPAASPACRSRPSWAMLRPWPWAHRCWRCLTTSGAEPVGVGQGRTSSLGFSDPAFPAPTPGCAAREVGGGSGGDRSSTRVRLGGEGVRLELEPTIAPQCSDRGRRWASGVGVTGLWRPLSLRSPCPAPPRGTGRVAAV
jgi:hypothetical protein